MIKGAVGNEGSDGLQEGCMAFIPGFPSKLLKGWETRGGRMCGMAAVHVGCHWAANMSIGFN
eukprot:866044-Pelagomonas_calceolata.AAC.2